MAFADRFTLRERVGIGATGEVFRAFDKLRGVDVAIKRLHDHLVADPFSRERFRCETALSARVDSPYVARCFDGGIDDDDRPYLVLEWLEGYDLATRMKAGRISVAEAIEITRQTACALQALHDVGIVHRDVKPRNLFVAEASEGKPFVVKLLDLGIALDARADRPEATTLGTPHYMSPEQACGSKSIGPVSDLFSLGILFFELLTGRRPFVASTTYGLLAKIVLQARPRLTDVWPDAPVGIEGFIQKALAYNPAARFSSAREMAEELAHLAQIEFDLEQRDTLPDSLPNSSFVPNRDQLVAVLFGRLPLSTNVDRCRDLARSIVEVHAGFMVSLLGRGIVASFPGWCADGLLNAAEAALDLSRHIEGARWSLVSGVALAPETGLSESLIDRGTRALERARTGVNEPSIRIDDETAASLEEHYVIEGSSGALSLRSVRETH